MSEERTTKQRWRCPADDGTSGHLAVDIEQALNLRAAAEFFAHFATVRCLCGRELVMRSSVAIGDDVILARRVQREERAKGDAP
jgi:hypothetical protein